MPNSEERYYAEEAVRAAQRIDLIIEELWRNLEDVPLLGDDGVAELLCEMDNRAKVLRSKLEERQRAVAA